MKTMLVCGIAVLLTGLLLNRASADGFPAGWLLGSSFDSVYAIDPETRTLRVLLSGQQDLSEMVYDPVTESAFVLQGSPVGERSIMRLKWRSGAEFEWTPFVQGLSGTTALAVDRAGNVYFDREELVSHRIWKADPAGNVTPVTPAGLFGYFYTPQYMAFSPDESTLYVSTVPAPYVEAVSLPSGDVSHFVDNTSFPGGVDVAADGTVYVTQGAPGQSDRILAISPQGAISTYLQEPWMEFMQSGAWGDLEVDDRDGTMYVVKGPTLYAVDEDKTHRAILGFPQLPFIQNVELIPPDHAVVVPGDTDENGRVDIFDVAVIQTKYGMTSGATWADGDFDGNGTVDIFDVAAMQVNYGYGVARSPMPAPEPSAGVLALLGLVSLGVRGRRRFRRG